MRPGWPRALAAGLLLLLSPVLLVAAWTVLVGAPSDVVAGLVGVFSGHDVVQVADGEDTAIGLLLLLVVLSGLGWLLRLRVSVVVVAVLTLLAVPIVAVLATGAEYGLGSVLAGRGYDYCGFHVTDRGRGENGTYVYARRTVPDGCGAVRTMFPPHQVVPGRRGSFDLPRPP